MKRQSKVAMVSLVLTLSLWALATLSSLRFGYISPEMVLKSALRQVVVAIDAGEGASKLKEIAVNGIERSENRERMDHWQIPWHMMYLVSGMMVAAGALLYLSRSRAEADPG